MKEADLYQPVRDWLLKQGYTIHVEVFGHDVIAVKDGFVTVVELKRCLSEGLIAQLRDAAGWADFVFGAVATNPRDVESRKVGYDGRGLRYFGYGLLTVDLATGKVRKRVGAQQQPMQWHRRRKYRMKALRFRDPAKDFEVAGLPSSPQLAEQRARRRNPAA